jgi:hypothetical protein
MDFLLLPDGEIIDKITSSSDSDCVCCTTFAASQRQQPKARLHGHSGTAFFGLFNFEGQFT